MKTLFFNNVQNKATERGSWVVELDVWNMWILRVLRFICIKYIKIGFRLYYSTSTYLVNYELDHICMDFGTFSTSLARIGRLE